MPVASNHHTRNQSHRSLQELGSIKDPQDLAFLNQPCYYETNVDSGQITVGTIQKRAYEAMPEEEMNVSAYIMNTLRFYWDWAGGMSGFALHSIKWIILGLIMLLDQLLVWLGRQITMVTGCNMTI
ncbi:unnamed protein product [Alternaria alternata]